jgi:hypothetical protein
LNDIEIEKEGIGQQYQQAHEELVACQEQLHNKEKELEAAASSLQKLETKRSQLSDEMKRALEVRDDKYWCTMLSLLLTRTRLC